MILTKEIAARNVGKFIDCYKRRFHFYPLQIVRTLNDEIKLKDMMDTFYTIQDEGFDKVYFDYIFENLKEIQ